MTATTDHSISLHSGEYVKRYNKKSIDRVAALARRMNIDENDSVADFACGNGMLQEALGMRKGLYHGIDFSRDFITAAQKRAEGTGLTNYEYFCQDIVSFCKMRPGQYSVATTLDFSEHIDDDSFVEIYSAIRGSIRPGGTLYVHTPNLDFFLERLKQVGVVKQFPEHIAVRSETSMINLLQQCGFDRQKINVEKISHYNILKILHPLSNLPGIGKYFCARLWFKILI